LTVKNKPISISGQVEVLKITAVRKGFEGAFVVVPPLIKVIVQKLKQGQWIDIKTFLTSYSYA
jgi:hypothetical protein